MVKTIALSGGNQMTAKITDQYRVYPFTINSKPDRNGLCYVNIRIADRKDRNKNIDVSVYLQSGERLKVKPGQLVNGKIHNGLPESQRNDINHLLDTLTLKITAYTKGYTLFNKQTVEVYLYGDKFLNNHKKARTRQLKIEVKERTYTPYYYELRKQYPKRKEIITTRNIDEDEFEVIEKTEIIIDPLSLDAPDFPKNLPTELYNHIKNDVLKSDPNQNKFFVDAQISMILSGRLYGEKTKEIVTIEKEALTVYEEINNKRATGRGHTIQIKDSTGTVKDYTQKKELITIQKQNELKTYTTKQIYEKDVWDKKNIFEMFGSIYYDKDTPPTYLKILLRLLEYRELKHPSENIKDLNAQWLIDFFLFLKENGYYNINTKTLDPLKYNNDIFFQDKPRTSYKPKSLNKMIGITKTLINGIEKFSFHKKGYLMKLDLSDLRLSKITDEKDKDGTRIEHNLNKAELDQLFWFEFDKKKLKKYQEIFNAKNNSINTTISIEDLNTARQLFVLQISFGGLRGYTELSTAKLLKHSGNEYKVAFYQNKVTNTVTNPLNDYSEKILKPLGYQIPQLKRNNTRKKDKEVTNKDILESHYRALIQTIGEVINFDRSVLIDGVKFIHKPIKEILNPYFSRKTFGTILSTELGLNDSEIGLFTGHKDKNESELSSSYIQKNTIENKKKLISKLKVGKKR